MIKTIIIVSVFILLIVFFITELAPEAKRVSENNARIDENNKKIHDQMNRSHQNYESEYNEDTNSRYWYEVP